MYSTGFLSSTSLLAGRALRPEKRAGRRQATRVAVTKAVVSSDWAPTTWREKISGDSGQDLDDISRLPPLVYSGEVDRLTAQLAKVAAGKAFLLKAADREEDFSITQGEHTESTFRLLVAQVLIVAYYSGLPVVKVGYTPGSYETIGPYRITSEDEAKRVRASYFQSSATLNLLRAVAKSTDSMLDWSEFISTHAGGSFSEVVERIEDALCFVQAAGLDVYNEEFREPEFYTSHELHLLPYAQAMSREAEGKWYDTSAHLLWVSMGSSEIDEVQLEYLRGVNNPIAIRIDGECSEEALINAIQALNPSNEAGRITITTTFGSSEIWSKLPKFIRAVTESGMTVVWACDPMRNNTIPTENGCLTCPVEMIFSEIASFFAIHQQEGSVPGGIYLDMTGKDISECVGGISEVREPDVCCEAGPDALPRLNAAQALQAAAHTAKLLRDMKKPGQRLRGQ